MSKKGPCSCTGNRRYLNAAHRWVRQVDQMKAADKASSLATKTALMARLAAARTLEANTRSLVE